MQQPNRGGRHAEVFRQQFDRRLVGLAVGRWRGGPNAQSAIADSDDLVTAGPWRNAHRDDEVVTAAYCRITENCYMTANGRNPETIRVRAPIMMIAKIGDRSKPPSVGIMRWNGRIKGSVIE